MTNSEPEAEFLYRHFGGLLKEPSDADYGVVTSLVFRDNSGEISTYSSVQFTPLQAHNHYLEQPNVNDAIGLAILRTDKVKNMEGVEVDFDSQKHFKGHASIRNIAKIPPRKLAKKLSTEAKKLPSILFTPVPKLYIYKDGNKVSEYDISSDISIEEILEIASAESENLGEE